MTKAYVIMGNDYPNSVSLHEKTADETVKMLREIDQEDGIKEGWKPSFPTEFYRIWYRVETVELINDT